jgi:hypothetical protein
MMIWRAEPSAWFSSVFLYHTQKPAVADARRTGQPGPASRDNDFWSLQAQTPPWPKDLPKGLFARSFHVGANLLWRQRYAHRSVRELLRLSKLHRSPAPDSNPIIVNQVSAQQCLRRRSRMTALVLVNASASRPCCRRFCAPLREAAVCIASMHWCTSRHLSVRTCVNRFAATHWPHGRARC